MPEERTGYTHRFQHRRAAPQTLTILRKKRDNLILYKNFSYQSSTAAAVIPAFKPVALRRSR
jgi:hypothetical protein